MADKSRSEGKQEPEQPSGYVLPDGQYLTVEQMEAKLKEDVTSAKDPNEVEEAKYKLATFYMGEAEPLKAYPILKAIHDATGDGDRKGKCGKWLELILGKRKKPPTVRAKKEYVAMMIRIGMGYAYGGSEIAAQCYLEKAIAITDNPQTKANCWLELGKMAGRCREYRLAVDFYSKAFDTEQEGNETWYFLNNNLGYALNQVGRHADAEPYLRRAIAIDPSRHNAHKNLGLSFRGQGKYREAATSLLEAVKLNPGDTRAMGHLEEMLECRPELYREIFGTCRFPPAPPGRPKGG